MTSVKDICDALGRAVLARRLGVRLQAVSNWVTEGKFPAKWYAEIRRACAEIGLCCPDHLFAFATASPDHSDDFQSKDDVA